MKKVVISVAALSMLAAASFAGSHVEPEMEPMVEVMEEEDNGSSSGLLIPLISLVAIGALIANSSSDTAPNLEG